MKIIRYIIFIVIAGFIVYNSVYFKKLDEVKAAQIEKQFNVTQYVETFWTKKLIPGLSNATEISELTRMLISDPENTFNQYSHALGIGNLRYFLVKGGGIIKSVNEDDIAVEIKSDSSTLLVKIATEYIFGNAVRDASGLISINEFNNTMDFNNVSAEINKTIRAKVLPLLKQKASKGNAIEFVGAIELNKEHLDLSKIEVIPIEIKQ